MGWHLGEGNQLLGKRCRLSGMDPVKPGLRPVGKGFSLFSIKSSKIRVTAFGS
jgi:hypothetical protein